MSGILADLSLSFIDALFDKENVMKMEIKPDPDQSTYWDSSTVDLDSILLNQSLDLLPGPSDFFDQDLILNDSNNNNSSNAHVSESICSDSGVSCDQQLSPVSFDDSLDDKDHVMNDILGVDVSACPPTISSHQQTSRPVVRVKPVVSRVSNENEITTEGSDHQSGCSSVVIPLKNTHCKGRDGSRNSAALKTIKIIKAINNPNASVPASSRRTSLTVVPASPPPSAASSDETGDDESSVDVSSFSRRSPVNGSYPRLQLTEEEKRLMLKEGISLPARYPLTKQEERDLKRIRRKIRNKISAQDSRKRKKEYVDGLEDRVKQCSVENANLSKKVKVLESENSRLNAELSRLKAAIANSRNGAATALNGANQQQPAQPATCLMVLVLSLALILAPNMRGNSSNNKASSDISMILDQAKPSSTGARPTRAILEPRSKAELNGFEDLPVDGLSEDESSSALPAASTPVGDSAPALLNELVQLLKFRPRSPPLLPEIISALDHDYASGGGSGGGGAVRKRSRSITSNGFVVPPIDGGPPLKKRLWNDTEDDPFYFVVPSAPSDEIVGVEIELPPSGGIVIDN